MCCSSSSGCPQCFAAALNLLALAPLGSSAPGLLLSFSCSLAEATLPPLSSCPAVLKLPHQALPPTDDAQSPAEQHLRERSLISLISLVGSGVTVVLLAEVWAVSPGTPCTFPHSCLHSHPAPLPALPHVSEHAETTKDLTDYLVINNTSFSPCPSKNPTPFSALDRRYLADALSAPPQYSQLSEKPSVLP